MSLERPPIALLALCACAVTSDRGVDFGSVGGSVGDATGAGDEAEGELDDDGSTSAAGPAGADESGFDGGGSTSGDQPAPADDRAFLHVELWSTWWNDRTRCGAERTFLEICQRRDEADCTMYQQAYDVCDPAMIVNGQVGPEQQGNELCGRGKHPAIGGCVAAAYDFDALRFWWCGAEWQGNWPWATIKLFPAGADWTGGGELLAFSSLPGTAAAVMAGIANHGLGFGCTMPGVTEGDDKYQHPFGGFAWIEVPTDVPVTLAAASGSNFGDQAFAGCSRGAATQRPWVTAPPGAEYGCVFVQDVVFAPGRHYLWQYGQLHELPEAAPPEFVVQGFGLPEVAIDVATRDACAL